MYGVYNLVWCIEKSLFVTYFHSWYWTAKQQEPCLYILLGIVSKYLNDPWQYISVLTQILS